MKQRISIPTQTNYSQAFKLQVVREYERGFLTKDALRRTYADSPKQVEINKPEQHK